MNRSRHVTKPVRRATVATAVVVLTVIAAACSGGSPSTTTALVDGSVATDAEVDQDAFPVQIDHMLGSITIESAPQRVVALGMADADIAIALGVTPLTVIEDPNHPGRPYPWLDGKLDLDQTELIPQLATGQVSLEHILSLRPDLVLATTATGTIDSYDAATAAGVPVLVPATGFLEDTWQDLTRSIGKALGRSARAEALIAETEGVIEAFAAAHAGLEGKTFVVALDRGPEGFNVLNDPDNSSVRLFTGFGMQLPPRLLAATGGDTAGGKQVATEQVGLLDADVLFMTTASDVEPRIKTDPIFQSLGVVQRGDYLAWKPEVAGGIRIASPLSIPYVLDQIEPTLARVASPAS
jgi:iron complex transport system substrate-binding protein